MLLTCLPEKKRTGQQRLDSLSDVIDAPPESTLSKKTPRIIEEKNGSMKTPITTPNKRSRVISSEVGQLYTF
jgi:hypothetical protein